MFRRQSMAGEDGRDARDEPLREFLRAWQGIEPHADFDDAVWRRIRAEAAPESHGRPFLGILREWVPSHPVWASAVAAAAAVIVGVLIGGFAPAGRESVEDSGPLVRSQTLAGSYIAMTRGEPL